MRRRRSWGSTKRSCSAGAAPSAHLKRSYLCRNGYKTLSVPIAQANAEPPQLGRHRMQLQYWGGAIGALETLILHAGSLEAVLAAPEPLLDGGRLQGLLGEDMGAQVMPPYHRKRF